MFVGEDWCICFWDLFVGSMIKELCGYMDMVYSFVFSVDGILLVLGGLDSSVRVWDFG